MDRRKFLNWVGVGMFATSLPVILASCTSESDSNSSETNSSETNTTSETTTPPVETAQSEPVLRDDGYLEIGTIEELDSDQFLIDKTNDAMVIRSPEDESLLAFNPLCPHRQCTVDWQPEETNFSCPCHASIFSITGEVISGPAKEGLESYEVMEEEGKILVKLA